MLFLMNDTVLDLDLSTLSAPSKAARFDALPLSVVLKLGAEQYAQDPLLQRHNPERAKRIACLIVAKSPAVNAAHFEAPAKGCAPEQVTSRLAELAIETMAGLYMETKGQTMSPAMVDSRVWKRMAA
jgi:hypothetical protein